MNIKYEKILHIDEYTNKAKWEYKTKTYRSFFDYALTINEKNADLSIIIICWKNNPHLEQALISANNQKKISKQIIFVNNGAGTSLEWCKEYADTYIQLNSNTGAYLARNIGSLFSQSKLLLFLEDDGLSDKLLAYNHFNTHKHLPNIISTRGVYFPISNSLLNKKQNHYYYGKNIINSQPNLEGNAAFKKDAFMSIGGWDDNIQFGHGGLDIAHRFVKNDYKIEQMLYIPHAILYHDYTNSDEGFKEKISKQKTGLKYLTNKDPTIINTHKTFLNNNTPLKTNSLIKSEIKKTEKRLKKDLNKYNTLMENILGYKDINKLNKLKKLSKYYDVYALGAGSLGKKFAELCYKNNIKISGFFDKSSSKPIDSIPISNNIYLNKKSIIVITTSFISSAINDINSVNPKKIRKTYIFR